MSPKERATAMEQGLIRVSAPSIPSKFLTPFIDDKLNPETNASAVVIEHEFCRMSKLVDDKSRIGPGSYNLAGSLVKNSRMVTNWQYSS